MNKYVFLKRVCVRISGITNYSEVCFNIQGCSKPLGTDGLCPYLLKAVIVFS